MVRRVPLRGVDRFYNISGSFDGKRWIHIGWVWGDSDLYTTPEFSSLYEDDQQWLLKDVWKVIPKRQVRYCPLPVDPRQWTENDFSTQRTVDTLSRIFQGSGQSEYAR